MCKKTDCPIFDTCDKEMEQALYCRKVELLIHLSKVRKPIRPRLNYIKTPVLPVLM